MIRSRIQFHHTIRFKVSVVVAAIIFIAVMASSGFSAVQSFERDVANHRAVIASAGSAYVAAIADPVASQDRHAALSILRGIRDLPNVLQADITLRDGSTFAQLGTGASLRRQNNNLSDMTIQQLWNTARLRVELPIVKSGEQIGTLGLLSDLSEMRRNVIDDLVTTSIIALLAIVLAIAAAQFFIGRTTAPLLKLTASMANFADGHDLNLPDMPKRRDETGILSGAFAEMIARINERDRRIATHMETLEDTVEARTKDLRVARDEAEAANAAKSDFLATMSHEIRTPMNGMLVMAEMLSTADLSARHRRYTNIILRSGNNLLTIINDILDLSKIESGHLDLEAIPVSPEALATDVVSLFWERARESDLQLAAYISPRVPSQVLADPTRLNQIITNLVNNALKFTETGGVLLDIDCKSTTHAETTQLVISVRDTGIGIPTDKIGHIFESFSQADQTTTRRFGGTGLGLSICKRLVGAMGGEIQVESTEGRGSTFTVTVDVPVVEKRPEPKSHGLRISVDLPEGMERTAITKRLTDLGCTISTTSPDMVPDMVIVRSSSLAHLTQPQDVPTVILSDIGDTLSDSLLQSGVAADSLPNPYTLNDLQDLLQRAARSEFRGIAALHSNLVEAQLQTFDGLRILAADDNAVNREVLREILSTLKVEAVFVENGEQAVQLATRQSFDLIFMDGSMPVMDGFEATQKIRAHEHQHNTKRTPIFALTAQVAGRDAAAWSDVGADGHIAKPFSLDKLFETFASLRSPQEMQITTEEPAPSETAALLNTDTIATLDALGGTSGRDVRKRIWEMFKEKAPIHMQQLVDSGQCGPLADVSITAHALKSMALSAGAAALADILQEMELAASDETKSMDIVDQITNADGLLSETLVEMDANMAIKLKAIA